MTYILCLETSSTNCSVSIAVDNAENQYILDIEEDLDPSYSHGRKLHGFIDILMNRNQLSYKDLNAIAVSAGPGSYTGLRIGVSSAKGLCYALDIPLIAIDTLKGMASPFVADYRQVVVMQDARRMEVYAGVYSQSGVVKKPAPVILDETTFSEYSESGECLFVGSGVEKFKALLADKMKAPVKQQVLPRASYLCGLAINRFRESDFENLAYFEPNYLKAFKAG